MKSIQEIFENSLFRIPDYQRGFAWKDTHLDDFWQDLRNLQDGRFHYTGAITLEIPTTENLKKWRGDDWIISAGSYKPFYVVDGQQRLTSIIVLLNILIELMDDEEQYLYLSKEDLIEKYIYKRNEKRKLQSFIFGYEIDDPSYEYLKTKIFKQESAAAANQPETTYTNNLGLADKFFREKLLGFDLSAREKVFKKVTQQLKFDIKIIENDLDIFVVFETMNNRGKPLTNLEKLKNRLIYLTTLMPESDPNEKKQLREEINEVWKTCYEYLGKNKNNPLNDDSFLRNHFIVYHSFEKSKEFPHHNLFKEIYTVQRTVSKAAQVDFQRVKKYINSLQKASQLWYAINNPKHAQHYGENLITIQESYWLEKLNRLGFRVFGSLTLSVFMVTRNEEERIEYLKAVINFIFFNYMCAGRKSNLGNSEFPYDANMLYNKKDKTTVSGVTAKIFYWTFGGDGDKDWEGYFTSARFIETIKELFSGNDKNGYYGWPGLRFLLYEYEESLKGDEETKVKWSTPNSIEHIYPQDESEKSWKETFSEFTPKQRKFLSNSLGNLVLLRQSKNSQLSNKSFDFKRGHTNEDGSVGGYVNGSHSEIEVSRSKVWDAKSIFKRGKRILEYMNNSYALGLTAKDIKQLLLIDEGLMEKL